MENRYQYSENQKRVIYEQMIIPLKEKISQIVLYDSEKAMPFLEKLNEILKIDDGEIDIITQIVKLEFEINQFLKENRTQIDSEQAQNLATEIDDVVSKVDSLSITELEKIVVSIEERSLNGSFNFSDTNEIEGRVNRLKARILEKRVVSGDKNLKDDISIKDVVGIKVALNEEIAEMLTSDSIETRMSAEQAKNRLLENDGDIYDIQLYKLINAARRGIIINSVITESISNEELLPTKKKTSIFERFKSLFTKTPVRPLKLKDLDKVSLEWLANQIPEEELPKDENGVTISSKMHILNILNSYKKNQWDLTKRYSHPEEFEDVIMADNQFIRVVTRPLTGDWGGGILWNEELSCGTIYEGNLEKDSAFQFVTKYERTENKAMSSTNNKKYNYDSNGYTLTGPLSRSFGMIKIISEVLGEENLKEEFIQELSREIRNFRRFPTTERVYRNSEEFPDGIIRINDEKDFKNFKKNPFFTKMNLISKKFLDEIEEQKSTIVSQDKAERKQKMDVMDKYRVANSINPINPKTQTATEKHHEDETHEEI